MGDANRHSPVPIVVNQESIHLMLDVQLGDQAKFRLGTRAGCLFPY